MSEPKRCMQAVLAGFGGQGILFAGKIIANAGLLEDRELSWLPSYGPEMRGGTANCSVCISDDPIGSPLVLNPDVLVVMNQPSLDKFEHSVQPGGLVIVDSTLVPRIPDMPGVTVCAVPATGAEGPCQRHLGGQAVRGNPFLQRGDHSRGCGRRGPGAQEGQAGRQPARPGAGYPGIVCDWHRRSIAWARGALGVGCRGCRCDPRLMLPSCARMHDLCMAWRVVSCRGCRLHSRLMVQSIAIARVCGCKSRSISRAAR